MNPNPQFDYVRERLDRQIVRYGRKASSAKRWNTFVRVIEIIAAASIPALAALGVEAVILALPAAVVIVAAALAGLGNWQDLAARYRTVEETLKAQKYAYLARVGPYADGNVGTLVRRCEAIISAEHYVWSPLMDVSGRLTASGNNILMLDEQHAVKGAGVVTADGEKLEGEERPEGQRISAEKAAERPLEPSDHARKAS